jgi:hypothetical protein
MDLEQKADRAPIPWHELSPHDMSWCIHAAHRAMRILQRRIDERQFKLLPHHQMPDAQLLAMDFAVLKLSRPTVDLESLSRMSVEDFMEDTIALMTCIDRVDGRVPTFVHFACDASSRKNL